MIEKIPLLVYEDIMLNKGYSLDGVFIGFQRHFGFIEDNPRVKELFLEFLTDLMYKGEMKLYSYDENNFLKGSVEEQINLFRNAWPNHYDEKDPLYDINGLWWNSYAPAGAVWCYDDGGMGWT
ncbi:hypothetical protein A1D23_08470 [Chelonobacter oris]|uniref:DUF596 domain-containing protein n=1 Tax=Chelonobacter oris TaxID=505317 RepID=A0A0A3BAR4_9PAST|nr:DUF596 domain-containing protein [Chelonobacter oris]KGQ70634.1 hypothetical protein OA57_04440 [Chelonobacter oris]MDH3000212.1 hypothetical protein [Chelonobacter oris]